MAWVDIGIIEDEITEDEPGRAKAIMNFYDATDVAASTDSVLSASFGGVTIPARRGSYSVSRPRCKVVGRRVERINRNDPFHFRVTINFEDPTDGSDTATLLSLPIDIKSSGEKLMEDYLIDADGAPVCNTSFEPFDQQPQRMSHNKVFTCVKYVTATGKANLEAAALTNNASAKTILGRSYPTDTLVLCEPDFDEVEDADGVPTGVYRAQYEIRYNKNKWIDAAPDMGFTELIPDGDTGHYLREDITQRDKDGNDVPVCRAWPLDGSGLGQVSADIAPATLTFYPYAQNAWSGVALT
jgi:hypothetical protein